MKLTTRTLFSIACLAAVTACGGADKQDGRTHGAGDINVDPRKVHSSGDATATTGSTDQGSGTQDPGQTGDGTGQGTTDVNQVMVKAGLRNFQQINATMSTLTGVAPTTAAVKTAYTTLSSSLPTDNDIKAFLGSNQVAVFKLAVEYCNALTADTTKRTAVYGAFNFAGAPSAVFTAEGKKAVADALVTKFWGKDLATLPPHEESVDDLSKLIDDLLTGKDATSVTLTPAIVTAVCSAALASAPVTMF